MAAVGDRVRLVACDDPHTTLAPGALGTVKFIDGTGTVHVDWDDGSSLGLIAEAGDRFEVVVAAPVKAELDRLVALYGDDVSQVGVVDCTEDDWGDLVGELATLLGLNPESTPLRWESFQGTASSLSGQLPGTGRGRTIEQLYLALREWPAAWSSSASAKTYGDIRVHPWEDCGVCKELGTWDVCADSIEWIEAHVAAGMTPAQTKEESE